MHIPQVQHYWSNDIYFVDWILRFVDFSFQQSQCCSWVHVIMGGSSRHQLKSFWSINLFLGAFKKFSIFIFWRVRYASFSDQPLLILYILLTKILMFLLMVISVCLESIWWLNMYPNGFSRLSGTRFEFNRKFKMFWKKTSLRKIT